MLNKFAIFGFSQSIADSKQSRMMMPESTYTHSAEGKVLEHVVEAVEKNVDLYASLYDVWWDSCGANSNSLLVDGSSTRVHQNQLLRLNLEVQRNICNDCMYFLPPPGPPPHPAGPVRNPPSSCPADSAAVAAKSAACDPPVSPGPHV